MKVKVLQTVKAWINPDGKIKGTYLVEISDTDSSNGEKVVVVIFLLTILLIHVKLSVGW